MFSTHLMKYIWFTLKKSKYPLYIKYTTALILFDLILYIPSTIFQFILKMAVLLTFCIMGDPSNIAIYMTKMKAKIMELTPVIFYLRILHLLRIILSLGWKVFISVSPRMQ